MQSNFEPPEATSLPSTVPVTVMFPVTSIPAPTSKLPATSTVPSVPIENLFVAFLQQDSCREHRIKNEIIVYTCFKINLVIME